jgi:transcriptional regulator with XRE-family HTH domain
MKLKQWLKDNHRTADYIAHGCNVTRGTVSHWCTGRTVPTVAHLVTIERLTDGEVRAADFVRVEEDGTE